MRGTDRIVCACLSAGMSAKEISVAMSELFCEYGRYEYACDTLMEIAAQKQLDCVRPNFVDDSGEFLEWGDGLKILGQEDEAYVANQEYDECYFGQ